MTRDISHQPSAVSRQLREGLDKSDRLFADSFRKPKAESRSNREPSAKTQHITNRPKIGLTMGDAAGIGPEIIIKALAHKKRIFNVPTDCHRESCYPSGCLSIHIPRRTSVKI